MKLDGDGYAVAVKGSNDGVIGTDSVRFLGVAKAEGDSYDYGMARVANIKVDDLNWALSYAKKNDGYSLLTTEADKTTAFDVYTSNGNTQYFDVNKTIWTVNPVDGTTTSKTTVTANADQTVSAGDKIVVAYDKDKVASYVYVIKTETNSTDVPTTDPVLTINYMGYNDTAKHYEVNVVSDKAIAAADYSYAVVTIEHGDNFKLEHKFSPAEAWTANVAKTLNVSYSASNPATDGYTVTVTLYDANDEVVVTTTRELAVM